MPRSTDAPASARDASARDATPAAGGERTVNTAAVPSGDPAAVLSALLAGIERELPHAVELRHRLHAHPELAHAEHQTSALLAEELPVPIIAIAGAGLLARVGPADGAAVAVRAELDGLPITERTGAPFSADPAAGRMHACGHDVHMAALVALARAARTLGDVLPAPLVAMLQPSEEAYPSGAQQLASELALPRESDAHTARSPSPAAPSPTAPSPSPEESRPGASDIQLPALGAIVAAHVHPELPWGTVALDPGTINASCDYVTITLEGESAHGAYPHRGRDPILAIAEVIVSLHAQLGRRIDPVHPATLTVGVLEGGSAENVIPERAQARAALRAHRPEDRLALRGLVEEVVAGVAAAHGCRGTIEPTFGEPALDNDPDTVTRARTLLAGAGLDLAPEWRSCGSDDFAFFGALGVPLAMGFVGLDGAVGFVSRPLHHPELLVPDAAVGAVARAQAVLYLAASSPQLTPE